MKIEFKNGSTVESIQANDIVKSNRTSNYRTWCVEIRDKETDQYIEGGCLTLEKLLELDYEDYGIVFLDKDGAKTYEQHKRLYEEGAI